MGSPAEDLKKNASKGSGAFVSISPAADDPRWQVVQRVVAGPTFAKAARLSQFLLYVCERAILGRLDEVSEQHVGMHVFGRQADYNSNDDNIVRTHARLLRKKLDEYYAAEGKDEPLRILIPKGGPISTPPTRKMTTCGMRGPGSSATTSGASAATSATINRVSSPLVTPNALPPRRFPRTPG